MDYRLKQDFGAATKHTPLVEVKTAGTDIVQSYMIFTNENNFDSYITITADQIPKLIEQGIIEPIEVPTWTDSQMIEFGIRVTTRYLGNGKEAKDIISNHLIDYKNSKQEEGK